MAGITHAKTSAVGDSGDASLVQPSDWNDDHGITGAVDFSTYTHLFDVINESTGAAGVTIEGVLLKDSGISFGDESLTEYDEGTWTPALTFATPGDLSVAYSEQTGRYTRIGARVFCEFNITTSTFTHGTASGNLVLTGLPFAVSAGINPQGALTMKGHSIALAQWITIQLNAAATTAYFSASRDNTTLTTLTTAHIASGVSYIVRGSFSYTV